MNPNLNPNSTIETGIGPMVDNTLNSILDRLTGDNFREKLTNKIVDPVTDIVNQRLKPYVNISLGLYAILIVLLCIIIYLLVRWRKKC
jgi:hypothetical protein